LQTEFVMPIYMDLHTIQGVTAKAVAEAHILDVKIQDNYFCKALTYWVDESKGCVFCLFDAPDKESVRELHAKSHGLIPHEIIEVNPDVVQAFLGRIQDPTDVKPDPTTQLKIFHESAFRVILLTRTKDVRLLLHNAGRDRARELLLLYSTIVHHEVNTHKGCEVYRGEEGFVTSFINHNAALECALTIQEKLKSTIHELGLRIVLHAGNPVEKHGSIFGSTLRFASFLTNFGTDGQITISAVVRDLFQENDWKLSSGTHDTRSHYAADETFLHSILETLSENWQNSEFDVPDFVEMMSTSKSQLYRRCVAITGISPNALLREYRLMRALDLLRKEDRNISQTTFDTGFSSPSYFTKCFQKRFGLQPLAYLKTRL
jgi:AraC-like DNA-binding protein